MIYRRKRTRTTTPGGFYRFESVGKASVYGVGFGDYVRLRDENGNVWQGSAESQGDNTVRYRFRDSNGNILSGISDRCGIVLRDEKGNTWRGLVD
ncbi:MAG: hypothetical protein NTY38_29625 [Acidobacteria bacterium]|nr:hypothetical protein [Acidobacteriota bacterium]